jgi:hypothetical protein
MVKLLRRDKPARKISSWKSSWLQLGNFGNIGMRSSLKGVVKYFISDQLLYLVNDVINHPRGQLQGASPRGLSKGPTPRDIIPFGVVDIYVNNFIIENYLRTLKTLVTYHSLYFYSTTRYHALCSLLTQGNR